MNKPTTISNDAVSEHREFVQLQTSLRVRMRRTSTSATASSTRCAVLSRNGQTTYEPLSRPHGSALPHLPRGSDHLNFFDPQE